LPSNLRQLNSFLGRRWRHRQQLSALLEQELGNREQPRSDVQPGMFTFAARPPHVSVDETAVWLRTRPLGIG
jgi:hypothetical protein